MSMASIAALIPLRPFAEGKQRLASLLSPSERATLSRAMLADVLAVVVGGGFDQTIVVTNESDLPLPDGVGVVREGQPAGLNAAIAFGARHLAAESVDAMIVVPADLPQLLGATLESCRAALAAPRSAVLVPAAADGGTNLLGLRPVDLIAPAFGPDSFARHVAALRTVGINPLILNESEARYDIDRPDDIFRFLALDTRTEARAFLESLGLSHRRPLRKALETQA